MDRGFGSTFRGSGFGGGSGGPNRQISDRRYDDFYSDGGRRVGQQQGRSPAAGGGNANRNRNSGEWGGSNRDRGFFNQGQGAGPVAGRERESGGNVSGQMLAALQQQQSLLNAFMTSQSRGILPSPRGNNSYGQGAKGGRYGGRPGDKRKQDMAPSGFQNKRNRRPPAPSRPAPTRPAPERRSQSSSSKTKSSSQEKSKPKSPPKKVEEVVVDVPDIPDDEVEIPDSLMESVEKLRQRKDVQRNVADEDIQKLLTFSFTGKGYQCLTCGLLLMKEYAFSNHLDGKSHVMKVIDARTAKKYQPTRDILDIDLIPDDWYEKSETAKSVILKQAKVFMKTQRDIKQREIDNYNKNPANFFTVSMETRKAAVRSGSTVTIKSIVETSMEIKDFASDKFFGCEFIKAISAFDCRLCGLHIKESEGVIPHIESRLHKNNYQQHLRKVPGYEKVQKDQNNELSEALKDHEDSFVLLTESSQAADQTFLAAMDSHLIRVPKLFKPDPADAAAQKKEEEEEEEKKKKDAADEKKDSGADKTDEKNEEPDEEVVVKEDEEEIKNEPEEDDAEGTEDKEEEEAQEEPMCEEESEVKEEVKEDDAEPNDEGSEPYDPYDPANGNTEEVDDKQEESNMAEEEANVNGEEKEEEEEANVEVPVLVPSLPKKSILKNRTPRGGAKRGRGRGAKATPSPRSRVKKTKDAQVTPEPDQLQDEASDGSFMGAFQVVDEVEED